MRSIKIYILEGFFFVIKIKKTVLKTHLHQTPVLSVTSDRANLAVPKLTSIWSFVERLIDLT